MKILDDALLPKEPVPADAFAMLNMALAVSDDRPEEQKILRQCIAKYPRFEWASLMLARAYPPEAEQFYKQVLEINPHNAMALSGLANLSRDSQDEQKKVERRAFFKQLMHFDPYYHDQETKLLELMCNEEPPEPRKKDKISRAGRRDPCQEDYWLEEPADMKNDIVKSLPNSWEKDGDWGYAFVDKKGRVVFAVGPNADPGRKFSGGMIVVNASEGQGQNCNNGHTQYWNHMGGLALEESIVDGKSASYGMCAIKPIEPGAGQWGFVSIDGKNVIKADFDEVLPFSEGLAAVRRRGVGWGFVDKTGLFAIEPIYDDCLPFSEGLAAVEVEGKVGFIDKRGALVIPPTYDLARSFSEGLAKVAILDKERKARYEKYIDRNGKVCLDLNEVRKRFDTDGKSTKGGIGLGNEWTLYPEGASLRCGGENNGDYDFHEGLLAIKLDHKFGYIRRDGTVAIEPKFDSASAFKEGRGMVVIRNKAGFVNHKGELIIPADYIGATDFSEGLAAVSKSRRRWGYIDKSGVLQISPRFVGAGPFSEGLAKVALSK